MQRTAWSSYDKLLNIQWAPPLYEQTSVKGNADVIKLWFFWIYMYFSLSDIQYTMLQIYEANLFQIMELLYICSVANNWVIDLFI